MVIIFLMSIPMALLWMIFVGQFSLESSIVGYIFGIGILLIIRINTFQKDDGSIKLHRIPFQLIALIWYIFQLSIDVVLSGIDVGKHVIQPKLSINPDVQTISTQDKDNNWLVSALSAHSITITPGELVIDFKEDENGQTLMLVHTLDKERSNIDKLKHDQAMRLKLIRQILGHDEPEED
jgi:multicomponent Na+:H+ antiporter subunit E